MAETWDWIVIGSGLTGAALSYELTRRDFSVLLLDQHPVPNGATRFSYGGIAYWSGTTDLTRQLCREGIHRYHTLSEELGSDLRLRELDLVLTIDAAADPEQAAAAYAQCAMPPQYVGVEDACMLEPWLNPQAIAGALTARHGHVSPEHTVRAYIQAFLRSGGTLRIEGVSDFLSGGDRITGVATATRAIYSSDNVAVCAGGRSRALLEAAGITVPLYFTHAELLETAPIDLKLRSLVMPAVTERLRLEAEATQPHLEALWDEPGHEPAPHILDAGAIQLHDGRLRMGQISRTFTDPEAEVSAARSEAAIRTQVGKVLPALEKLPANWHHCLVSFSRDRLPLIGAVPGITGLHLFSGFSNPFAIVPTLAQRFARHVTGLEDATIFQLSPTRFE